MIILFAAIYRYVYVCMFVYIYIYEFIQVIDADIHHPMRHDNV